jgi:hypothetical protein
MSVARFLCIFAMLLLSNVLTGGVEPTTKLGRVPVMVELFTSEGCSSCPPADALLIDLDLRQPVAGAEVVALGEHVDYWNELGWKDRFSSTDYTQRQGRYATHFHLGSVYTPQMVINGRTEFVGNDASRAEKAIAGAAHRRDTRPSIAISAAGNLVDVNITNAGPRPLDVLLAITESDLSTQVGRGENHGRLLHHTAVVRDLRKIGETSSGQFAARPQLALKPDWRRDKLCAVIFLQDPSTLEITGAAQVPWK